MFWVSTKRIIRSGFFNFSRNAFVSLSSILVMTITLSVIAALIFLSAVLTATLSEIRSKVDINVYFVTGAQEPDILAVQKNLRALPEVDTVTYTSSDQALENFKSRHENDQFTLQALSELEGNPLGASLNIKAKDTSQYQGIADYLQRKPILSSQDGTSIIDKVNYYENKSAIDKLTQIIHTAEKLGSIITIALICVSILITFNTIRLAIFISKEEISVMRLVGASAAYIRGPFVVVGTIYGAISGLITLVLFYPVTLWLGRTTANFFLNMNIFDYYTQNFVQIFCIIMISGMVIGSISSYLAVRKYLKI